MTLLEALQTILGEDVAQSIIDDMGEHWAIVAAVADPRAQRHPKALRVIREHRDRQGADHAG